MALIQAFSKAVDTNTAEEYKRIKTCLGVQNSALFRSAKIIFAKK